ncbi:ABC transporter substrate-binding protein [Neotabrizicola shimadae]|uniref:ABC transporter substrate-binding protein n=1 Tax=Neotabrizicola shimadae TaxID=2807096 RepID=A0A8G0ZSA2_9RHOB|nr:ABC transporter substrate-binding protein [Neotabrizicola shimadae]QYZ69107.1 ABC transporter substrate-binding protein [Neotabrizicola shimadae]
MSRRLSLSLVTAIVTICSPALAENVKVTYGTNWVAQAEHGGFYQAVADGTYAACGLDVTIVPGGPSVNNQAQLLAGNIDFYMGGTLDGFFAVQQGLPLVNVAAMFQKDPQVILTHPGVAKSFDDLKKLKLFISDGGYSGFYMWMMSIGFTAEQRAVYTFNSAPFIADEQSGMQGYVTSEPFSVEKEAGWKPDLWLLADNGYTSYSTTIQTLADTIANKPDVVKCFVDGSIKGWYTYLYGDNAAANAMIKKDNPDMSDESIAFAIEKMKEDGIVDSGDTETLGVGAMTDERMADFYAKMVAAGVIPDGIDIKQSYTLAFVNQKVGMDLKK